MLGLNETKTQTEKLAGEIRAAEKRLQAAEQEAAQLESAHQERIGAALADGGNGGDVGKAAQEIVAAKLTASALRTAIETLKGRLRESILADDAKQREEAQSTRKEIKDGMAAARSEMAPHVGKIVKIVGQAYGHAVAFRAAVTLNEVAEGRCWSITQAQCDALKAAEDPLSRALKGAISDAEKAPDVRARYEAASRTLEASPVEVERRLFDLTHDGRERELRDVKRRFDSLRAQSPTPEMLAQYAKSESAQIAEINKKFGEN